MRSRYPATYAMLIPGLIISDEGTQWLQFYKAVSHSGNRHRLEAEHRRRYMHL